MKQACDRDLWRAEILRFKENIEEVTGKTITPAKLQEAIRLVNGRRRVLQRLNRLRAAHPVPISGRDVLLANQISFYDDPVRFTDSIGKLCDELEQRVGAGQGGGAGRDAAPDAFRVSDGNSQLEAPLRH